MCKSFAGRINKQKILALSTFSNDLTFYFYTDRFQLSNWFLSAGSNSHLIYGQSGIKLELDEKGLYLSNRKRFPCLHSLIETVMQTRDEVEGLPNRREFSQRLECLYQAIQTQEKSFLLLLQNNFPEKKTQKSLYGTD